MCLEGTPRTLDPKISQCKPRDRWHPEDQTRNQSRIMIAVNSSTNQVDSYTQKQDPNR